VLHSPALRLGVIAAFAVLGCSREPAPIDTPRWEPEQLTANAMRLYDADGSDTLDAKELQQAPSLAASLPHLDANQDHQIGPDELQARLKLYEELQTGLRAKTFRVTWRGRPLADAKLKLIPERFLEGVIEPAEGVTDASGTVVPQTATYDIPAVRLGFYRVEIDSETTKIPEKYHKNSILGIEISPISEGYESGGTISLDLK